VFPVYLHQQIYELSFTGRTLHPKKAATGNKYPPKTAKYPPLSPNLPARYLEIPVTDTPVELPAGMMHACRKCIYTSIAQAEMPQKPIPNQHTINSKTVSKKKIIIFSNMAKHHQKVTIRLK